MEKQNAGRETAADTVIMLSCYLALLVYTAACVCVCVCVCVSR